MNILTDYTGIKLKNQQQKRQLENPQMFGN